MQTFPDGHCSYDNTKVNLVNNYTLEQPEQRAHSNSVIDHH